MLEFHSMIQISMTQLTSGLIAVVSTTEFLAGWGSTFWNIFQVAIGLGFVIFVHELGHFLAAKFFGVKCEKFYVGFDVPISIGPIRLPAKLFHFQWGETEYGIGSIPLGGYVKMLGQDDDPRNAEKENERIRVASPGNAEAVGRTQYDPRSFPAKSVFARMVIISAGVVMNIIFGILFAAIAFNMGVPYLPTIVGDTFPGDPAWQAGLQAGDQIVQIGDMKTPNPDFYFEDMREKVALAGLDNPKKPMPIVVIRNGETIRKEIVGTMRHDPNGQIMTLGLKSTLTTKVGDKYAFMPLLYENWPEGKNLLPDLEPGDTIIGVNGVTLPVADRIGLPLEHELNLWMHPRSDETITLQVDRVSKEDKKSTSRVDVPWKPLPMRTLGINFQLGPVVAVQNGSAAEESGVAVGDTVVSFDGQPIENAFTLPLAIAKKKGETVKLMFRRASKSAAEASSDEKAEINKIVLKDEKPAIEDEGEEYSFEWKVPEKFLMVDSGSQYYNPVGFELPGSGIVVQPKSIVSSFANPSGKESELVLRSGDVVQQIRLDTDADEASLASLKKALGEELWDELSQGKTLEGGFTVHFVHSLIQRLPIGTKLKIYFFRDNQVENVSVQVANDPHWAWFDRGLMTLPAKLIHQVSSPSEALSLGVTEIQNKAIGVLRFLRLAITWKVPRKAAAGPIGIFQAATSVASESTTKLLLFFTMLSANLAVLNFLPIPALDGGHMVFLIAEAIRGKPVNEAWQMWLTVAGVFSLIALMLFVTFNDFTR